MIDPLATVRTAFGNPQRPLEIHQRAFDGDEEHLHRLIQLEPGQRAAPGDLVDYCLDFEYNEVQRDLLRYVFPFCLQAWEDDLRGRCDGYGAFIEYFYPALLGGRVFEEILSPSEVTAVADYFRSGILREVDEQRGLQYASSRARPYRWFRAFATYGVLLRDIQQLWSAWWAVETIGRAVAVLQYISCLIYDDRSNPVFERWTCDQGGGPPILWEYEGHLYDVRWLEPNVVFLRKELTGKRLRQVIDYAVARLRGEPESATANRISRDLDASARVVESRCQELPDFLGKVQQSPADLHWSL
jgi:hypothetical protein